MNSTSLPDPDVSNDVSAGFAELLRSEGFDCSSKTIRFVCTHRELTPQLIAGCLRAAPDLIPLFEQKIGSHLSSYAQVLEVSGVRKLLEVLDLISDCSRIRPLLIKLRTFPDPQVQSKLTLLLGRGSLNLGLIEDQLASPDARVRANTIKALPDVKGAQRLLKAALTDPNHRVVGEALLALHRLGDSSAAEHLIEMAQSESEASRLSALWVMGETEDEQFRETLRACVQSDTGKVRWMALKSLSRLKRASAGKEVKVEATDPVPEPGVGQP